MLREPVLNDSTRPLVSVLIINWNYGRYLRQCFESVFSQTYDNIEINFSDNASTDDSWDIALEYARKYPGIITMTRNRKNFGADANMANCGVNIRGKYFIELCSDDAFMPDYVRQCVTAMENNVDAGYVMVNRNIIDENGHVIEEPPFYNQSCVIPGAEQAAVYMMATVNPSISQIMYYGLKTIGKRAVGGIAQNWYGTRIMDFNMCCQYPMIYIKESLLLHRIHSENDSVRAVKNLIDIMGPFVLQHQFAELGAIQNLTKVVERLPASLDKLGKLCMRYCVRSLCEDQERRALRYFHLAMAITPEISEDPTFQKLTGYWSSGAREKTQILEALRSIANLTTRSVSYDPPPGSVPIDVKQWES
jgi:glycosyltransferase involved in cell wall biosynthesis